MFGMLIAYDADGNVLHTRDFQVVYDPDTLEPLGFADYRGHEDAGGENTVWWKHETFDIVVDKKGNETRVLRDPQPVKGSKVWPEWLGGTAHHFRIELDGPPGNKRIAALVHKESGHRRERAAIEAEIANRIQTAHAEHRKVHGADADVSQVPVDLRDVLGGPDRPLLLDEAGKTRPRVAKSPRPNLPVVRRE